MNSHYRPRRRPLLERLGLLADLDDLLRADISRTDDRGPDWPLEVAAAMATQDMEYALEIWGRANEPARDYLPL